jgi:hypothetical protein
VRDAVVMDLAGQLRDAAVQVLGQRGGRRRRRQPVREVAPALAQRAVGVAHLVPKPTLRARQQAQQFGLRGLLRARQVLGGKGQQRLGLGLHDRASDQSVRGHPTPPRRGGQGCWGRRDVQPRRAPGQAAQHPPAPLATPALRVRPQNRPTCRCEASPGPHPGCASRLNWACSGASRGCIGWPLTLSSAGPA